MEQERRAAAATRSARFARTIYKNRDPNAFWRLIDEQWLRPDPEEMSKNAAWELYCAKVDLAKAVHKKLSGQHHPETQAFYGAGKEYPSCDRIELRAASTTGRTRSAKPSSSTTS